MMDYCFVIQPFDDGKFDKRYKDVFKPALEEVEIEAYRVDKDPDVSIPIESIEEKIINSRFCLADITTDNPNVWYEVGFAIALNKELILICSDERKSSYPFDIQHRNVTKYKTESRSDFDDLKRIIISRSRATLNKPITINPKLNIKLDSGGLTYQEIAVLGAILANQNTPDDTVSAWIIKQDMKNSGLNEIAFSLATRKLLKGELVEISYERDYNNDAYPCYLITQKGNQWIIGNESKFSYEYNNNSEKIETEDVPF